MMGWLDWLNQLDPAVVAAVASGVFVPTIHDTLVRWDATARTKAYASTIIAAAVSLAAALAAPGDLTLPEAVTSIVAGLGLAEVSYRKQKGIAEGTDKPTPFAIAPRFGIGGPPPHEGD